MRDFRARKGRESAALKPSFFPFFSLFLEASAYIYDSSSVLPLIRLSVSLLDDDCENKTWSDPSHAKSTGE